MRQFRSLSRSESPTPIWRQLSTQENTFTVRLEGVVGMLDGVIEIKIHDRVADSGSAEESACASLWLSGDQSKHSRNLLHLTLQVVQDFGEPHAKYTGDPNAYTCMVPEAYFQQLNQTALDAFIRETLRSWAVGVAREITVYGLLAKFWHDDLGVKELRYASPQEDHSGWDLQAIIARGAEERQVLIQVTGQIVEQKDYGNDGTIGVVSFQKGVPQPIPEHIGEFLRNLHEGRPRQLLVLPSA